jgi:hypothetical protein
MSGTQLVEIILAQIDESNKSTSTFHNQFKDFFSSLDVKTLPFPVRLVDDLKRFNSLPDSELDPGYTPKWRGCGTLFSRSQGRKALDRIEYRAPLLQLLSKSGQNIWMCRLAIIANSAEELLGHPMISCYHTIQVVSCYHIVLRESVIWTRQQKCQVHQWIMQLGCSNRHRTDMSMSGEDIRKISQKTIEEIACGAASPLFKQFIEETVLSLLQGHLEVCQRSVWNVKALLGISWANLCSQQNCSRNSWMYVSVVV